MDVLLLCHHPHHSVGSSPLVQSWTVSPGASCACATTSGDAASCECRCAERCACGTDGSWPCNRDNMEQQMRINYWVWDNNDK